MTQRVEVYYLDKGNKRVLPAIASLSGLEYDLDKKRPVCQRANMTVEDVGAYYDSWRGMGRWR